ncbi:MAG: hypothetical protein GKR89_28260 [Candidatus Latescibacteria bacterium]|nr:hypothetical protein [Candidatus Latescibacterota bacterium]
MLIFLETPKIPTGAVWRPALWVFGRYRTAVQSFEQSGPRTSEWANRLDLFANLRLTGTERLLVGLRPLDALGGAGYNFAPEAGDKGWQDDIDTQLKHLFFEGDVGELLPFLDPDDSRALDYGFAVGRQTLNLQEGLLLNDAIDLVGLTRNSLQPPGVANLRITGLYGWNGIHRHDQREDTTAQLWGLLSEWDWRNSTLTLDLLYTLTDEGQDLFSGGLSALQRLGRFNTSLRLLASLPPDKEAGPATRGALLFSEISLTPHATHDVFYCNSFWAIGDFVSAARGPLAGGPLGRTGLLFAAANLGRFGAPLDNQARRVFGGSIGRQFLFGFRRQLILEISGRRDTDSTPEGALATGARYQQAWGRRTVLVMEAFTGWRQNDDQRPLGGRIETLIKF